MLYSNYHLKRIGKERIEKMKPFISVKEEHKYLFDLGTESTRKKLIHAAIQLNVFTELDSFESSETVAEKLGYDSFNTKALLDSLTSVGMLKKENNTYKNTEIACLYLSKNADSYAGNLILGFDSIVKLEEKDIIDAVKNGADNFVKKKNGLEAHSMFGDYSQILVDSQRLGRATEVNRILKKLPEYKEINKMLDLGGGPGLISMAIAIERNNIEGVIFETPQTVKLAESVIKEYNMSDRFTTLSGDYMKDSIGEGYDLVLAVGTLNFAKHDMDLITKKIYNSLNDGGLFINISEGITDEETKPTGMILGWFPALLKGVDFRLKRGEVSNSALKIGFKNSEREVLRAVNGILDVDILRK